jgi:hypothetical protein
MNVLYLGKRNIYNNNKINWIKFNNAVKFLIHVIDNYKDYCLACIESDERDMESIINILRKRSINIIVVDYEKRQEKSYNDLEEYYNFGISNYHFFETIKLFNALVCREFLKNSNERIIIFKEFVLYHDRLQLGLDKIINISRFEKKIIDIFISQNEPISLIKFQYIFNEIYKHRITGTSFYNAKTRLNVKVGNFIKKTKYSYYIEHTK